MTGAGRRADVSRETSATGAHLDTQPAPRKGTIVLIKDNAENLAKYRAKKGAKLRKTAPARRARDRRKAAYNEGKGTNPAKKAAPAQAAPTKAS
jgi:hypothetical protein